MEGLVPISWMERCGARVFFFGLCFHYRRFGVVHVRAGFVVLPKVYVRFCVTGCNMVEVCLPNYLATNELIKSSYSQDPYYLF